LNLLVRNRLRDAIIKTRPNSAAAEMPITVISSEYKTGRCRPLGH
jgi:hypothetical protein